MTLWEVDAEELHVLVRRARLQWSESGAVDSDYGLKKAIEEANVLLVLVEAIQEARKVKSKGNSPIGSAPGGDDEPAKGKR